MAQPKKSRLRPRSPLLSHRRDTRRQWLTLGAEMKRELQAEQGRGPAACPRGGWGLPSPSGGQAGRGSAASIKSSKSLEKPGTETRNAHCEEARRIWTKRVFGCLGPVFLCSGKASRTVFPASSSRLNGFAPHPRVDPRMGPASEPD